MNGLVILKFSKQDLDYKYFGIMSGLITEIFAFVPVILVI